MPGDSIYSRYLVVTIVAVCFALAHEATLLRPLGLDPTDPQFVADREAHVVDVLVAGLRLPPGGGS